MDGIKSILICLAILIMATSCKSSGTKERKEINWEVTPFVFDGCKMYFKGKEFQLGWPIKDYEKIFGKYDRVWRSLNDVYTFDQAGIMLLSYEGRFDDPRKDTVKQIDIVFNYDYLEIEYFDEKDGITDKMQIPENYARPKIFYRKKILLNGVELQFGPGGISVDEANRKLARVHIVFEKKALASMRFYFPDCSKEIPMGQVFSTATLTNTNEVDEFHIGKDFWNED